MKRRDVIAGLAAASGLAILTACNPFAPASYHYRMTVEVDTPEGAKAFSAVRAMSYSSRLDGGYTVRVQGQAVVIDLPGGPMFALLVGADGDANYAGNIGEAALVSQPRPGGENPGYRHGRFVEIYPTAPRIVNYMPDDPLPMLVHFADIDDPTSVERVDPDNLAAVLGQGVSLKRVTIEKTNDPVTTGIEERLGWLSKYPEPSLDPTHGPRDYSLPATLHHGAFQRGVRE